jgi:hypothetical protein
MEMVFETAGRASGYGILVLQQEQVEMVVWNGRQQSKCRWCFVTTARAEGDGVLELQQEQMEMVFWNCSKSR